MKKFFCCFVLFLSLFNIALAKENKAQPDFGPYMKNLQKKIKSNWQPPTDEISKRIVTLFTVDKTGNISNIKIIKSAGTYYDEAAIEAIKKSSPLQPLPVAYAGDSVDMQFTFDYNVFGHSNNSQAIGFNQSIKNINNIKKLDIEDKEAYKAYNKRIKKIVLQNLPKEKYQHKKIMQIELTIKKDGQVKDAFIKKPSGSKSYDELVLNSLKNCVFPNFPEKLHSENIKLYYEIHSAYGVNYKFIPIIIPLSFLFLPF